MTKHAAQLAGRHGGNGSEIALLRARAEEAEEMLRAITCGQVDAIVRSGPTGAQVFTLKGAERPYRLMVETMAEGAITLASDGIILYGNQSFADLVRQNLEQVIGARVQQFVASGDVGKVDALLRQVGASASRGRIELLRSDGTTLPAHMTLCSFGADGRMSFIGVVTDLSDVMRAASVSEQLAHIVDNALDGIIGKDLNGIITSWNKAAELIYGYPAAEIVGKNINILAPPERKNEVAELIAEICRGEEVGHRETVRVTKAGKRIDILVTLSPIKDNAGKVVGVSTITHDISDRKLAERQAQAAARYARDLLEASLDPLVTISAEGKITDVNEATVQATGISRYKLIGSEFAEYFTDPDEARAGYRAAFTKGSVKDYPLSLRHRTGTTMDVLYNATVYRNADGEIVGLFAAARDVTERKRAETAAQAAAYYARNLIEASLDPLVTISADGKITDVNKATEEATGLRREKLLGTDFANYFTEPDTAIAGYHEAFVKGSVKDYALSIRHKSGTTMDVLYNATVYRDSEGKVAGLFAAARDITQRKRDEEELRMHRLHLEEMVAARTKELADANVRYEAANKELETFAYSVSHDLRSPLRAIDGFSHILLEDYASTLDAEGQRLLNVVRDSTVRMGRLIDDILAFSRVGRTEMAMASMDMESLAHAVIKDLEISIANRKVRFKVGALPQAWGDTPMIRRVWLNLLDNAVKYTVLKPEASVEIGASAGEGETVYFVRDNGVGFDMQYVDKLFGVFQRLHGNEFPGTGIGLAIVKRIVTRHGGRVWAEGKLNEGATFYFALPSKYKGHA